MRSALRVVLVATGTGVGKTHVATALLTAWRSRAEVVGLKPIETGIVGSGGERRGENLGRRSRRPSEEDSDQRRLAQAAGVFHVKHGRAGRPSSRVASNDSRDRPASRAPRSKVMTHRHPEVSLFAFPEPVSPHLAARDASVRIDLGAIERWVESHEAPVTIIETAGGVFSPLGHGCTNFELVRALRPDGVILVAPDRLGVLHELTTTLALCAARGGPQLGVVLSTPGTRDASTGRNAAELSALGIAIPIAVFPRARESAAPTLQAAELVIAWIEQSVYGAVPSESAISGVSTRTRR